MSDATRTRVGRAMAGTAMICSVVGLSWLLLLGRLDVVIDEWVLTNAIASAGFAFVAWIVLPQQPRNNAVWVVNWAALSTGLLVAMAAVAYQYFASIGSEVRLLEAVPSDYPTPIGLVLMQANWLWMPLFLFFTLGIFLFPDGKPPSTRWRWIGYASALFIGATSIALAWLARPTSESTLSATQDTNGGFNGWAESVVTVGYVATFAIVPFCVAGLIVKVRRSSGIERQQFRWVAWGASLMGILVVAAFVLDEIVGVLALAVLAATLGLTLLVAAFGIAIGKYRLYDVDVVISRTFVYGFLGLLISVLYVAIVVGVSTALGSQGNPSALLSVVAIALVAIVIQPVRRQLQRLADLLVYGKRATPYQVLSDFARQVAAADESLLVEVARSLVDGTSGENATIWLATDDGLMAAASWPASVQPGLADHDLSTEVVHDGELLGIISVRSPKGVEPSPADQRLLAQIGSGIGLALRNFQLTADLQRRVEDLRESRRRIVAVQDETRRRLERDLHDGAQQHLVALKVKMGLAANMARSQDAVRTAELLAGLGGEADDAIQSMRDFARGIYPPLLQAEGLGAAISAQARKMPVVVSVEAPDLGRYGSEIESTVYFCVLESLQNVVKHAQASSARVLLRESDGQLQFAVSDNGVGLGTIQSGSGLTNLVDRIDSVGGVCTVESEPGQGTTVSGSIPLALVSS